MVFILLATEDAQKGEQIRQSLGAQSWWVTVVSDREGALRAAADQEPEVVIIDATAPGAAELVRIFGSSNGGPGAVVLGPPEGEHESLSLVEAGADEVLSNSPPAGKLVEAVERVAAIPHQNIAASALPIGRQLTAEEIFGDILFEVDTQADEGRSRRLPEPVFGESPGAGKAARRGEDRSMAEAGASVAAALAEGQRGRDASEPGVHAAESAGRSGASSAPPAPTTDEISEMPRPAPGGPAAIASLDEARGQAEDSASGMGPAGGPGPERAGAGSGAQGEFGQYRLEERIAVGGMAEVWRASMSGLEGFRKTVAIKKILPHLAENEEFVAMFVDEAKLAAQLSHENLVDIYDLGKIDGDFFIAMEYVDGKDLRSILNRVRQRQESMPLGLALFIAARTASALDYAHARLDAEGKPLGLVHRDVSPRNILISHNGNVRLCDFGVAKAVSSVARTEIGALKGKIQYMSPEQAAGARVDARSDVFSLGSVLFEMVTGRRLFVEDTEITLLDAVRLGATEEARSVRPDVSEEINTLLARALAKDPAGRYQTAGEMQHELDEALFTLDPKPTQAALARWLRQIFESPGEAEPAEPGDRRQELVASAASSSGDGPERESRPVNTASQPPVPVRVEEVTAETKVARPRDAGRRKFWLGVAAGLLLAILMAAVLGVWLGGEPESEPEPVRVTDEVRAPTTAVEESAGVPAAGQPDSQDASGDR